MGLNSMTCTKSSSSGEFIKQVESSLGLLRITPKFYWVREEDYEGIDNGCIGNQVKLRAWLLKYWALIYRHVRAQTKTTRRGTTSSDGAICIVMISAAKCCGLYECYKRGWSESEIICQRIAYSILIQVLVITGHSEKGSIVMMWSWWQDLRFIWGDLVAVHPLWPNGCLK